MSRVLGCGVTVCCLPALSVQRHILEQGLVWVLWQSQKMGGPATEGQSEGPRSAAADCTSLGMATGVGGETCSCAEAKLDTDLGSAVVQMRHATAVGMLLSQRKMLGRLTNVPEAAGQKRL